MPDYTNVHDWLMRTLSGLIVVGVIASLISVCLLRVITSFVRKLQTSIQPRIRSYTKRQALAKLARLKRLHEMPNPIRSGILEGILAWVVISISYAIAASVVLALIFRHRYPVTHTVLDFLPKILVLVQTSFLVLFTSVILVGKVAFDALLLERQLRNYEKTYKQLEQYLSTYDQL